MEVGDVTGDDQPEIVVVTHDQGVVAVLSKQEENWAADTIDQKEDTFVHEVEIGDVDGDGQNEIFATPSAPNTIDGSPQPGWVVMYKHTDDGFEKSTVAESDTRHYKEILVSDVDGDGRPELYAVLEAGLGKDPKAAEQVEIQQYRFDDDGKATKQVVATLPDKQCRFLHAGDVDGDGKNELVASAFKSGVWVIRPGDGEWATECIDPDSSGYEHASALADMDADGTPEIYVAADDQHEVRVYAWNGSEFERTMLFDLAPGDITFGLMAVTDGEYLTAE